MIFSSSTWATYAADILGHVLGGGCVWGRIFLGADTLSWNYGVAVDAGLGSEIGHVGTPLIFSFGDFGFVVLLVLNPFRILCSSSTELLLGLKRVGPTLIRLKYTITDSFHISPDSELRY